MIVKDTINRNKSFWFFQSLNSFIFGQLQANKKKDVLYFALKKDCEKEGENVERLYCCKNLNTQTVATINVVKIYSSFKQYFSYNSIF